jgi:hypothetical protein
MVLRHNRTYRQEIPRFYKTYNVHRHVHKSLSLDHVLNQVKSVTPPPSIGTTTLSLVSARSTVVEHSQHEGFTVCRCQRHVKPPTWRRSYTSSDMHFPCDRLYLLLPTIHANNSEGNSMYTELRSRIRHALKHSCRLVFLHYLPKSLGNSDICHSCFKPADWRKGNEIIKSSNSFSSVSQ